MSISIQFMTHSQSVLHNTFAYSSTNSSNWKCLFQCSSVNVMEQKINITRIIKSYLFNDSCYIILHKNNYPKHLRQSQIIFVNVICASFALCMATFSILHLKTNWFTRHIYYVVNLTIQRFRKNATCSILLLASGNVATLLKRISLKHGHLQRFEVSLYCTISKSRTY